MSASRRRATSALRTWSTVIAAAAVALTGTTLATATDPVAAAATPPSSVTLVGDLQSELGCAEDWAPACTTTAMTDPDGDGDPNRDVCAYGGNHPLCL